MPLSAVEPRLDSSDPKAHFVAYLDYYRDAVERKLHGMTDAALHAGAERTGAVLADHDLAERGAVGGRFEADPPTLAWICFHVLQEYARHAGHLDVARELSDGATGE